MAGLLGGHRLARARRLAVAAARSEAATAGTAVPARAVAAIPATPAPAAPRRTERRDRRCCAPRSAPVRTAGEPMSSWPLMDIPSGAGTKPFAPAVNKQDGSVLPCWTVGSELDIIWTAQQRSQ